MPTATRFSTQQRVPLAGSQKQAFNPEAAPAPAPEAKVAPATGTVTVSVIVRRKQPIDTGTLGQPGTRLSRQEYVRLHGPDPESIKLVKSFAREFGLEATLPTQGRRTVHLTGSATAMAKAFDVSLRNHKVDGTTYRVRQGTICLPQELTGHVVGVLGLDNRPQAKPHYRKVTERAANTSYTPLEIAQLYDFPTGATASGQTIGIIELGGGYRATDLKAYFKSIGAPAPIVTAVSVDKGKNKPSKGNSADGEVMLDIEVCAAVAPGAKIVVYFAPNTDQGFIDAIATAVHDTSNKPSVISISWGGPESSWTPQATSALDAACQSAAALGITVTVAAGDDGSTDGVTDNANHVDFPASSPHVLACGGTRLDGSGSTISSEVVWNELANSEGATGGGVSSLFPIPTWQQNANVPASPTPEGGRGVPDVAGDADPATGYTIRVDGQTSVIGGTSAVAPLWAGLIALANAQNKVSAGFINPVLYSSAGRNAFRDITSGNNGAFSAAPGWDPCTGLGSPIGTAIITAVAPQVGSPSAKTSGTKRASKRAGKATTKRARAS